MERTRIFGIPIWGVVLPFVGRRQLPINRDGSYVDSHQDMLSDRTGYYYLDTVTLEWLGLGIMLKEPIVRLATTGESVDIDWLGL